MRNLLLSLLFALVCLQLRAQQRPFQLKAGEFTASLENRYTSTNRIFFLDYTEANIPTYRRYQANLSFAYGISKRITVSARVGAFEASSLNRQLGATSGSELFAGDKVYTVGDQSVGLSYLFGDYERVKLSAVVRFGIPTGTTSRVSGLRTGDGEWDQTIGLQAAYQSKSTPLLLALEVNLRNRTLDYASDFNYDLRAVYQTWRTGWVTLGSRGRQTLYDTPYYTADGQLIGGELGLYANNEAYFTAELSVRQSLSDHTAVEVGLSHVVAGSSTLKATIPSLTLHYRVGGK